MMEKLVMTFFLMASLVSNHSIVAKRRPIRSVLAPAGTKLQLARALPSRFCSFIFGQKGKGLVNALYILLLF